MGERIFTLSNTYDELTRLSGGYNILGTYYEYEPKRIWDFIAGQASRFLKYRGFEDAAQVLNEHFLSDNWPIDEKDELKRRKNIFINYPDDGTV